MSGTLLFFNIGGGEIFFILLVVVMFFGADRIPEIARGLGKGMRQIKHATNDIKQEINRSAAVDPNLSEVKKTLEESKQELEDIAGSVQRKPNN